MPSLAAARHHRLRQGNEPPRPRRRAWVKGVYPTHPVSPKRTPLAKTPPALLIGPRWLFPGLLCRAVATPGASRRRRDRVISPRVRSPWVRSPGQRPGRRRRSTAPRSGAPCRRRWYRFRRRFWRLSGGTQRGCSGRRRGTARRRGGGRSQRRRALPRWPPSRRCSARTAWRCRGTLTRPTPAAGIVSRHAASRRLAPVAAWASAEAVAGMVMAATAVTVRWRLSVVPLHLTVPVARRRDGPLPGKGWMKGWLMK